MYELTPSTEVIKNIAEYWRVQSQAKGVDISQLKKQLSSLFVNIPRVIKSTRAELGTLQCITLYDVCTDPITADEEYIGFTSRVVSVLIERCAQFLNPQNLSTFIDILTSDFSKLTPTLQNIQSVEGILIGISSVLNYEVHN
jgi:hypothetical protein